MMTVMVTREVGCKATRTGRTNGLPDLASRQ
jgi:hypothetical protein